MRKPSQSEKTLFIAICPKCYIEKPTTQDIVRCPECDTLIANFSKNNDESVYSRFVHNAGTLTIDWHPRTKAKYTRTVYLGISPGRAASIMKLQMYRMIPVQFTYEQFSTDVLKAREEKDKMESVKHESN